MGDLEIRELRYFLCVAEELHFGRAADRLGIAQPPLSRAIRQVESRLGVRLFDRDRRGTQLTDAGRVLSGEAKKIIDSVSAAQRRTQRAASPDGSVRLATKAGASHALLQQLLDATADKPDGPSVQVLLCEVGEQARLLRDGQADIAIMHRPVDDLAGFETEDLHTEAQVVILPRSHSFAGRESITLAELQNAPGPPLARWPRVDGSYPDGHGPRVRTQSQIAQFVALGKALLVIPASSRAWQWPEHVAVPVTDAPSITTVIAWPTASITPDIAAVVRTAVSLRGAEGSTTRPQI